MNKPNRHKGYGVQVVLKLCVALLNCIEYTQYFNV